MNTLQELSNTQVNDWNDFVLTTGSSTAYHLTYWTRAIEQSYGYKVRNYYLSSLDGKIAGIVPFVMFRKNVLCSLPFSDLGGIIVNTESSKKKILAGIKSIAKKQAIKDVELREQGEPVLESDLKKLESNKAKVSMMLPLSTSSDDLLKSFKPKLRSQINKAKKNGLTVKTAQDASLIDDFYAVISKNMRDLGSPVHSKKFYKCIMSNYASYGFTCVVYKGDDPCAAGITLKTDINACIPWASSLRKYNRLSPNMLLYWNLLAHLADAGIQKVDFGRSTVNEGTYRFKKQWGAQPVHLHWYSLVKENTESTPVTTNALRTIIESIWRNLPLTVTTKIGPIVRKRISL